LTCKEPLCETIVNIKPSGKEIFDGTNQDIHHVNVLVLELRDVGSQFMYELDGMLHFMDPVTFEELSIPTKIMNPNIHKVLEGGTPIRVRFYGERPVLATGPKIAKCTVSHILESREQSDKKKLWVVQVQGGARISCSVSVSVGDVILVNTEDLSFNGRA